MPQRLPIALFALALFLGSGQAANEPQSATARRARANYERELKALDAAYVKDLRKAQDQYRKELQKAREAAIEKGDLDEAQRILAAQKELSSDRPPSGFTVLAARWGKENTWADVTSQVQKQVRGLGAVIVRKAGRSRCPCGRRCGGHCLG
jgi:hypothetical protein